MSDILPFVLALFGHASTIVTGGIFAVGAFIYEHYFSKSISWRLTKIILVGTLLVSCFLAWRDLYRDNQGLRSSNDQMTAKITEKDKQINSLRDLWLTQGRKTTVINRSYPPVIIQQQPQPQIPLGLRASLIAVASDASGCLAEQSRKVPPMQPGSSDQGEWEKARNVCAGRYAGRIRQVWNEARAKHLTDKDLDSWVEILTNSGSADILVQVIPRLEAVAAKIPE